MRRMMRLLQGFLMMFGCDPVKGWRALKGVPAYLSDLRRFKKSAAGAESRIPFGMYYPCLSDRYEESGAASGHYFHQDLLVARRIHEARPERHIDVGSRIDGFVAHVASFRKIEVVDIRPLPQTIPNVTFRQADFMKPLPDDLHECCDSVSCLHAVEHFGLGRYGDPVDSDGWKKGMDNLKALLKSGGRLYLSVPIGPMRIEFNAHRVFSVAFLVNLLSKDYALENFSYVDDSGAAHENVEINEGDAETSFGCHYGCGIFELRKH